MKAVPLFDETELLRQIAEGSQRAFAVLFRRYLKKVYNFALKFTRSADLAEEVVQEVFLRIWLNRDSLPDIHNFPAYLSRMNRNQCLNALKRIALEQTITTELSKSQTEYHDETEKEISYRSTRDLIEEAINKLTPQQQKVYRLCHLEGLKYEEAAARLNISAGTVHTHMKQALKVIRTHMEHAGAAILIYALMDRFF